MRVQFIAPVALATLLLIGCGGGSSSPSEPKQNDPPPPSVNSVTSSVQDIGRPNPKEAYRQGEMLDVTANIKLRTAGRARVLLWGPNGTLGGSLTEMSIPATQDDGKGGALAPYTFHAKAALVGRVIKMQVVVTEGEGATLAPYADDDFEIVKK